MKKFLFLLLVPFFAFAEQKVDVLFVGFDAGETSAFIEVVKKWPQDKSYAFLTMATSQKMLETNQIGNLICLNAPANNRQFELSAEDLAKLNDIKANVVVTGVYSKPQAMIAEHFFKTHTPLVLFWDNFSTFDSLPPDLVSNFPKMSVYADLILVPTAEVAADINQRFGIDKTHVVGQPTLDVWENDLSKIDVGSVRKKLVLDENKPVITYLSGYEDTGNHYNESFQKFADSLVGLGGECCVLVQLHPRAIAGFEQGVLERMAAKDPAFPQFQISAPGKPLNTMEAVAAGSLIVCQRTNLGINATLAGKKVLYVDVADTIFKPFTLKKAAATQLSDPTEVTAFIKSALKTKDAPKSIASDIPKDSSLKFRDEILSLCR